MNPETVLFSRLSDDKNWRIRELSEIVRACNESNGLRRDALLRASVPIMYAHWEGFFVYAANSYLNFVTEKRIKIGALRDEFWTLAVRRKYRPQQISGDVQFTKFLLEIKSEADRTFKKGNFERINGHSNLRFDVLEFCCRCLGINVGSYAGYEEFIDKKLIETRNFIAHGASIKFEHTDVSDFRDKVIDLIRITNNEIENIVVQESYRRQSI